MAAFVLGAVMLLILVLMLVLAAEPYLGARAIREFGSTLDGVHHEIPDLAEASARFSEQAEKYRYTSLAIGELIFAITNDGNGIFVMDLGDGGGGMFFHPMLAKVARNHLDMIMRQARADMHSNRHWKKECLSSLVRLAIQYDEGKFAQGGNEGIDGAEEDDKQPVLPL